MKIKLSRSQWELAGEKAKWIGVVSQKKVAPKEPQEEKEELEFLNWQDLFEYVKSGNDFSKIPNDAYRFMGSDNCAYNCYMYIQSFKFDLSKVPPFVLEGLASESSNGYYAAKTALYMDFNWSRINNDNVKNKAKKHIGSIL